ncbi:MAG: alkaline phosphatase family protein [Candidatus Aminicenantes bacterium]|nr:alkaline phosphatase family protein [Candidatus Aminicenantes bacterium]
MNQYKQKNTFKCLRPFLISLYLILFLSLPIHAYIGPGAGFAFLSSFLVLFITFFLAVFSFLAWPFRFFFRLVRGQRAYKKGKVNRIVILGLDGMEPPLVEKYMSAGKMPHFSRLKQEGCYSRLATTIPSISPVAWSSFMTGCNPGKHNIFDFLSRDPKTYLPDLSSADIGSPKRVLSLGKYNIPLSKPVIKGLRKSIPFWKILGDKGIFSTILRIPITFPPEKFKGHLISGMCAPDLKGSQGTFSFYTSDPEKILKREGGMNIPITVKDNLIETYISGPENTLLKEVKEIQLPLTVKLNKNKQEAVLEVSGKKINLMINTFSDWIKISFKPGLGMKVRAICRFYISQIDPHFEMYMTPLNIDPEKPALPISHPFIYSVYLAKLLGSYTTLGESIDTWALNEGVLSEKAFLDHAYLNHQEWEKMLFNALDKTKKGVVASWFETTDSIQHMFFRYLDKNHPALKSDQAKMDVGVLDELHLKMDDLVGRVMEKIDNKSLLIIMSDHGFKLFRRGVNLNTWLYQNGYLQLKEGKKECDEWFKDVDWEKTKAYGLGLAGVYINQKGRESKGIVNPGQETNNLKKELIEKLSNLKDEEKNNKAVNKVYDKDEIPPGPFKDNCPDLIMGYNEGYRVSWDSVIGKVGTVIFEDNMKAWSGDHCIDPALVPGIFLCNRKINTEKPAIIDIAPTALKLFGVDIPGYIDGKPLIDDFSSNRENKKKQQEKKIKQSLT